MRDIKIAVVKMTDIKIAAMKLADLKMVAFKNDWYQNGCLDVDDEDPEVGTTQVQSQKAAGLLTWGGELGMDFQLNKDDFLF